MDCDQILSDESAYQKSVGGGYWRFGMSVAQAGAALYRDFWKSFVNCDSSVHLI